MKCLVTFLANLPQEVRSGFEALPDNRVDFKRFERVRRIGLWMSFLFPGRGSIPQSPRQDPPVAGVEFLSWRGSR